MAKLARDDEEQLIARSQHGDVEAFNQLIMRYQQATYGVVFRMLGNREAAADVTQDSMLAAFRAIGSFRGNSSLRAWLLRIASNMACDHWRKSQCHPASSLDELSDEDEPHSVAELAALVEAGHASNPEEFLLNQELQELIQHGLQELPLEQRVAVILCDIEGHSYEEIAQTTRSTIGTVRSRIARGRARLRKYLYQYKELLPRDYRLPF